MKAAVEREEAKVLRADVIGEFDHCRTVHADLRRRHQPAVYYPPDGANLGDGPEEVEGGNLGRQASDADDTVVSHR